MSLSRCIPDLVAQGKLDPERAQRAQETYDELRNEFRRSMGEDAADAAASARTVDAIDYEAQRTAANKLRQVAAQRRMGDWLRRGGENWGRGGRGSDAPPPGEGPVGPINPKAARTLIARMEARRRTIENIAFSHMVGIMAKHRRTVTGRLRNPADLDEIGRAAFGEDAPLAARELNDGWFEGSEYVRQRANAAGASIGKLERWGFPQNWDSRAVQQAGFENWLAAERPRWDLERMVDHDTGQPFTEAGLRRVGRYMFESIVSEGRLHATPGTPGRRAAANRLGEHRVIHYKSYDDWKASREQFGRGNAYDAMMGHIRFMARQVAAMEILGPNPEHGVKFLKDTITSDEALFESGQLRSRDNAEKQAKVVQRLWDQYTGALTRAESRPIALGFSAYRAVAVASKLGGAALTAVGDIGTGWATRRFNGLPQAQALHGYLKFFNPADDSHRRLAARLAFVPETWTSIVAGQNRFLAEELTGEVSSRIADGVLRASGLNILTDAGRAVSGLTWLTQITTQRGKRYDKLEPAFRSALARYGIGADAWDKIRATPLEMDGGFGWIKAENVADRELGDRVMEMALTEGDFAVPVPDLETQAYLNANARRGTFVGEMIRSSPLMFKTFTVALMTRHGGRMMEQPGLGKVGYFVRLIIPMTLMGALAVQLKEIAKGRDPRPMDAPGFWGHAFVMGGGSGIVGDLLGMTAENRFMGWDEFAAGPLIGDASRLAGGLTGMGVNVANDLGMDVKRRPGAAWTAAKALRQNIPGQNLWYARVAIDRLLADQVQTMIDPNYRRSWRMMERRARETGQEFWWETGETSPERAPDFANLLESPAN